MPAHLRYYYGSMASAKTLRLLSTAYNFEEKNVQIMVIKPALDTRDDEGIIRSRAGLERKCVMVDKDIKMFWLHSLRHLNGLLLMSANS